MHLCSAITWQLGGPRVQRANGGFLFSKNPPEGRAPDGWPDLGGRERKGILSLKFLLHCTYLDHFFWGGGGGSFSFYLFCIFFWEITPGIPDHTLKGMK